MKKNEESMRKVPETATTCTMIWSADGKIVVIGHPEELVTVHDKYEDAEKVFLECVEGIKTNKRYAGGPEEATHMISTALEMVKKSFEVRMMHDAEGIKNFLLKNALTVQFTRLGKSAYVIHNMETFKFLSDLSEIGILVPELFLSSPKIPMMPDQPYRDPEILKLIEQMRKKETP